MFTDEFFILDFDEFGTVVLSYSFESDTSLTLRIDEEKIVLNWRASYNLPLMNR